MKSRWKQYLLYGSLIIVGGGLIYLLVETIRAKNTGFEIKTLWDWMQLLIVPLFLAGGAFFLNRSEKEFERQRAEVRAKLEREIATDRQQEAALQAYIDRMSDLLLNEDLRNSDNVQLKNVARIRTLAVLRTLDEIRKGLVITFLYDAGLIKEDEGPPIIDLTQADLRGVSLGVANLPDAYLSGANLENAHLSDINLSRANLSHANLSGANLHRASLVETVFCYADLTNANLDGALLSRANFESAKVKHEQLAKAFDLTSVIMPDGTKHD